MIKALAFLLAIHCVWADVPTLWIEGKPEMPRIIKGEDANEGEFPYMASLRKKAMVPGHSCGASILTSTWVLTAAHCCSNPSNIYIYIGSIFLSKGGSSHNVEKAIIHENYNASMQWRNDICLIKVSEPFVFGDSVKQITLSPQDWPVMSGDKVTISGWGLTSPDDEDVPDRLQKGVDFIALSNDECGDLTGLKMFPGYLCARGKFPGQSTWNGDSGGPLVKNGAQVGLTSFGFRPYGQGFPTVYCRVTNYIDWIKNELGPDASQLKFE